ncbi:MAG: hypothetical protein ACJ74J_10065 [Blastocatellia bacterium]
MENGSFANPFFEELSRYAVKFAQPVFFGESPASSYSASLQSGTMTLLKFEDLFIGVTCQHVLAGYREMHKTRPDIIFQIGHAEFDPLKQLIDEDQQNDLATFNLTPFVQTVERMTESNFIEPLSWPPSEISEDDVICLAGFPGIWREQLNLGYLRFYSFSSGASEIHAASENHIVTRIEAEKCRVSINEGKVLGSLGGLSGGPVFCWRKSELLRAELVGFIYEYQENLDLMYIRAAKVLAQDGTFK